MSTEHPEDLDTTLQDATRKLHEAVQAMEPLESQSKVTMWQWREVQEAHEALTKTLEQVEWALRKREHE
jgi:hypothetical protein